MSAATRRPATFIVAMCLAHVLTMLGFSSFPTLQPLLTHEWGMSAAEAGAVNSAFFGGYTLAVPFLVSITDRIDPRRIYLGSLVLAVLAHTGFALFANGALHAALFSGLYGVSLAGTYMPGLRVLGEALPQAQMARATSFYTSSFSLGAAVSYLATAQLARLVDWHGVYVVAAVCSGLAATIVLFAAPASQPHAPDRPWLSVIDPRPVFKNRSAIAYSICYGLHSLELFTVRSWIVAFLAAIAVRQGTVTGFATPAAIAAFLTLIGMGASITGNEVALRKGRVRTIGVTMVSSGLMAFVVAAASLYSYWLAAGLAVLHGCFIMFELRRADGRRLRFGAAGPARHHHGGAFGDRLRRLDVRAADFRRHRRYSRTPVGVRLGAGLCPSGRGGRLRPPGAALAEAQGRAGRPSLSRPHRPCSTCDAIAAGAPAPYRLA